MDDASIYRGRAGRTEGLDRSRVGNGVKGTYGLGRSKEHLGVTVQVSGFASVILQQMRE